MRSTKASLSIASVLIALQCGQAYAQDNRQFDEVIVTAQKRAQSLQDVPIAVTAISGADLELSETNTIKDLAETVPGFTVNEANRPATSTAISVRGIGTAGNDTALEGSVGVFINGVFRPRSGLAIGDLVDIDSLEILRGPQGTLFGKNTSAGAVVLKTKDPVIGEFEGFAEATFGNFDLQKYSGAINFGGENFGVRFSGQLNDRGGYVTDTVTGDEYNDRDRAYIIGKALWEPSDQLSLLLTADYASNDDSCCQSVRLSNAPNNPAVGLFAALAAGSGAEYPVNPDPTTYTTSVNAAPVTDNDDTGVSLEVNYDLSGIDLTSITSVRDFSSFTFNDVDFSGADLVTQGVEFNVNSFSQELRFNGSFDGFAGGVDWLIGGFYSTDDFESNSDINIGSDLAPFFGVAFGSQALGALYAEQDEAFGQRVDADAEAFALFTHNIISLSDRLDLTLGLRYTDETKNTVTNPFFNHGVAAFPFSGLGLPFSPSNSFTGTFEDDAFSGTASLGYAWTDDIRTYVSYNRGFKSGGHAFDRDAAGLQFAPAAAPGNEACVFGAQVFPGAAVPPTPPIFACVPVDPTFESETVDSYEIGFRSKLLDRTLQLNVTAFLSEFDNYQLNNFDGFAFRISNAGSATTQGVELESVWLTPLEGLTLQGAVSYIDATFGNEVGSLAAGEPVVGGEQIGDSPEWSGTVGFNYEASLGENITGNLNASYSFRSETFGSTRLASDGSELTVPSRDMIIASAGLQLPHGVGVSVFCRNCADGDEPTFIFNSVAQAGSKDVFLRSPREYGVSLRKTF